MSSFEMIIMSVHFKKKKKKQSKGYPFCCDIEHLRLT
jgi:hypothetical protein